MVRSSNPTLREDAFTGGRKPSRPFAAPGAMDGVGSAQQAPPPARGQSPQRWDQPAEPQAPQPQPTALPTDQQMTVEGTVYKTALLLILAAGTAGAAYSWATGYIDAGQLPPIGGLGLAFFAFLGLAIVTAFKPRIAIVTGPIYAVASGVLMGVISAIYAAQFDGIVAQAILGTIGTAFGMLFAYRTGLIRVTNTFRKVVVTATLGIMVLYIISIAMNLFGASMPLLHDTGPLGIGISLFIVGIAALNLVLDFDFIAQASASGMAEKRMEWYGAFTLLVTLVWLYLEMLRLLAKLRD